MYTISDDLKRKFASEAVQTVTITVTPTIGEPFTITDADIMQGTFTIDRSIMEGSSLNLGSCVASELTMTLNNATGKFNGKVWAGAELSVVVGVVGSNETIPMGVFYVNRTPKTRTMISISALDGMTKFDRCFVDDPEDPTIFLDDWTLGDIISFACTDCGITLATDISNFPNASYEFTLFAWPTTPNVTYRQWISYAVALMGKVAWFNGEGELEIGFAEKLSSWENTSIVGLAIVGLAIVGNTSGSGSVTDTFGADKRYSSDYEDENITITGISYTDSATEVVYLAGTEDYTFDISGNLILMKAASISGGATINTLLTNLSGLIGFTYTPITMETVPCPHIYPTDWVAYVIDYDHYVYALVTNYTFNLNGNNYISAQGELTQDKALAPINSVATIQATMDSMEDYVIGSGDGWRAWKSGILECWKRVTATVDIQTAWGQLNYGEKSAISYPSMGNYTFVSVPMVTITGQATNGGGWLVPGIPTTTGTGVLYWLRPTKITGMAIVTNIYAVGRWK